MRVRGVNKLKLAKETLRNLSALQLSAARGGDETPNTVVNTVLLDPTDGCSTSTPEDTCPAPADNTLAGI